MIAASAAEDREQEAGSDSGADDAGDVRAHGVHKQEVGGIGAGTLQLADAGSHRNGGNTGGADQRVDLAAGELAHELAQQQAAYGSELKGCQTQHDDEQGLGGKEAVIDGGGAHGGGQEDRHNVHQRVLRRVAQTVRQSAFLEEVAEHQAAQKGSHGGQKQADENGHDNGEEDLLLLRNGAKLLHLDLTLFFGGDQPHHRRLDQRDQRHIGIGRDRDGREIIRRELRGQPDGGGAVRAADDADGGGDVGLEAEDADGHQESGEDAELGGGAEQQGLGVGKQGTKVGHRADAHEDQRGVEAGLDADVEDVKQTALMDDVRQRDLTGNVGVPQLGVIHMGAGEVREQHAEGDADQQQGLKFLDQTEVEQQTGEQDHHDLPPVVKQHVETGGLGETA